ncbi:MAG: flap endonuclease-1 [Candidatus Micrarchaeia archaeon]|jgi:flap endonuclease-1
MGVDLGDLAIKHPMSLEKMGGRIVAIDAFNTLYQFLSSIRQEDGTPLMDYKGRITGHLSGLLYRNARLLENGVRPVYVFDGKAPAFKRRTQQARMEAKKEAEAKWKLALEEERPEDAKKFAKATARLTPEMVVESKKLLEALGIPVVQAPSEGEAQAAVMVREGIAYASASQDYDSLLFGSPLLIRNVSITGKRKIPRQDRYVLVEPEEIILDETLRSLDINREQLVLMGLLIGTDFNEGIYGIGPKKALKIVKEAKTLEHLCSYVKARLNSDFPEDIQEIYEFFIKPPYTKPEKLIFGKVNVDSVRKILVDEHDFAPERIESTLEKIEAASKEKGSQRRMDEWF